MIVKKTSTVAIAIVLFFPKRKKIRNALKGINLEIKKLFSAKNVLMIRPRNRKQHCIAI